MRTVTGLLMSAGVPPAELSALRTAGAAVLLVLMQIGGLLETGVQAAGAVPAVKTDPTVLPEARAARDRADMLFHEYSTLAPKGAGPEASKAWREAVDAFTEITARYSGTEIAAGAWMRLGALQRRQAHYDEAIRMYHQVVDGFPGSASDTSGRLAIATVYFQDMKNPGKAIAWLKSIREPDSSINDSDEEKHDRIYRVSRMLLAEAYISAGQGELSAEVYRALEDRYPRQRDEIRRQMTIAMKMREARYGVDTQELFSQRVAHLPASPADFTASSPSTRAAPSSVERQERDSFEPRARPTGRKDEFNWAAPAASGVAGGLLLLVAFILHRKERTL